MSIHPQSHVQRVIDAFGGDTCGHGLCCGSVSLMGKRLVGTFTGWGPSLHRTGLRFSVTPDDLTPEAIEAALDPYLAVQRDRSERAVQLGFEPMRTAEREVITHLVADRLLMAIEPAFLSELRSLPWTLVSQSMPAELSSQENGGLHVEDGPADDVRPRVRMGTTLPWGWFDGERLAIDSTLPETVVGQLVGRRVEEVVEFRRHSHAFDDLGARLILEAYMANGRLNLVTAPEWTRIFG